MGACLLFKSWLADVPDIRAPCAVTIRLVSMAQHMPTYCNHRLDAFEKTNWATADVYLCMLDQLVDRPKLRSSRTVSIIMLEKALDSMARTPTVVNVNKSAFLQYSHYWLEDLEMKGCAHSDPCLFACWTFSTHNTLKALEKDDSACIDQ